MRWLACFVCGWVLLSIAHAMEPGSTLLCTQRDVMTMVPRSFVQTVPFTGELYAHQIITLVANTTAAITQLPYREGEEIPKGAVVVRLDDMLLRANCAARRAEWLAAHQRWIVARKQYVNTLSLYQQAFLSRTALDTAAMTDHVTRAEQAVAWQQLRKARRLLADATMRSPFPATLSQSFVSMHQMVMVGQNLVTLVNGARQAVLEVRAEIAADRSNQVRVGQQGAISLATGQQVALIVARIEPTLSPRTRALVVHLVFADKAPATWRAGRFVSGAIVVRHHQRALMVPFLAVHTDSAGHFVYVIQAGTQLLEKHRVTLGIQQEDWVELSHGVQAGDLVVVSNLGVLPLGAVVHMQTLPTVGS